MPKITTLSNVCVIDPDKHELERRLVGPGETIEVTDAEAKHLIEVGAAEAAKASAKTTE